MTGLEPGSDKGQTMVTVAIAMVALLAFLAIAVDVGQLYAERRLMQNAADAGALEGARQICFENASLGAAEAAAQATAEGALVNMGRTYSADPEAMGTTVTVTATETVDTFIAAVIGVDTVDVRAVAVAVCGSARRGVGGLWPLSVYEPDYQAMVCDEPFTIFSQNNENQEIDCAVTCDCDNMQPTGGGQEYPTGIAASLLAGGAPRRIGPGARGWLNFFDPPAPLPDPCPQVNCGEELGCWAQETHPGPVNCGDQLLGESGVVWSNDIRNAIKYHVDNETVLNIPLWVEPENLSCDLGPEVGDCGGSDRYPVNSFGCMKLLGYGAVDIPDKPGQSCQYGRNVKLIFAQRSCDCESFLGGTGGDPFGTGTRSISLIQ